MKRTNLFIASLILVVCSACGSTDMDVMNPLENTADSKFLTRSTKEVYSDQYIHQEAAFALSLKYIEVQDDQYILTMTHDDAEALNISPLDYDIIKTSVQETNQALIDNKMHADMTPINEAIDVLFSDGIDVINLKPLRTAAENPVVTGIITIPDNESIVKTSLWVPLEYKYVTVTCSSAAPLGVCSIYVYVGDQVESTHTVTTLLGICQSEKILLPVSNAFVTIGVKVSSAQGGFFSCILSID